MDESKHRGYIKGRGAVSNETGRYESGRRVAFDDGWDTIEEPDQAPTREEIPDRSRTVITNNNSPDVPFDRSINPYRGCEHGCVYCFARPTHAWLGMSPGLDFETRILFKPDAVALLRQELCHPNYTVSPINFGTNTDVYQPIEREKQITRQLLELLLECKHPVGITTKSTLIERDLDILTEMAKERLVHVSISLPTLDADLSRRLEPRTAAPGRRLATIERLRSCGIDVAVLVAPVIPLLTDGEIETILTKASQAGAMSAGYVLLRLPLELVALFEEWLAVHAPDKAKHVMNLVRETRAGGTYQTDWGIRQRGTGAYADLIGQRFRLARRQSGLDQGFPPLETDAFCRPKPEKGQLSLF